MSVTSVTRLLETQGTYQVSWHAGAGKENRKHLGVAYQAHLVFKALPSIMAGFLLTEEEWHL